MQSSAHVINITFHLMSSFHAGNGDVFRAVNSSSVTSGRAECRDNLLRLPCGIAVRKLVKRYKPFLSDLIEVSPRKRWQLTRSAVGVLSYVASALTSALGDVFGAALRQMHCKF